MLGWPLRFRVKQVKGIGNSVNLITVYSVLFGGRGMIRSDLS